MKYADDSLEQSLDRSVIWNDQRLRVHVSLLSKTANDPRHVLHALHAASKA